MGLFWLVGYIIWYVCKVILYSNMNFKHILGQNNSFRAPFASTSICIKDFPNQTTCVISYVCCVTMYFDQPLSRELILRPLKYNWFSFSTISRHWCVIKSFPWEDKHTIAVWRHQMEQFSALLAFCAGNSPVTGEFPAQRPVTRSFASLICAWINGWVNNREAGDLRRHRAHYDVIVMILHSQHHGCYCGFNAIDKSMMMGIVILSNKAIFIYP